MNDVPTVSHRAAVLTISAAVVLDSALGSVFAAIEHISETSGLYWAVATATTVGYGDVTPHSSAGRLIAVLVMLTVIPLFAASFSLVTSGLTAAHVHNSERRIKLHIEERLKHHNGGSAAGSKQV